MKRVLFVCLGNICRSPMAEGLFLAKLDSLGISDQFEVDSAGTGGWHVGERPDRRTLAELERHGIRLHSRARQLVRDDASFDYILCMDASNVQNARHILPSHAHDRVYRVLGDADVPDPYYGTDDGFAHIYRLLDEALDTWLDRIGYTR